jgi:Flp pilus assembly pilin Flp
MLHKPEKHLVDTNLRYESGQSLLEYGLIVTLISLLSIGAMQLVGPGVAELWDTIVAAIPSP